VGIVAKLAWQIPTSRITTIRGRTDMRDEGKHNRCNKGSLFAKHSIPGPTFVLLAVAKQKRKHGLV
jgi:hypothetical protein